jgi:hypothetical protein
MNKRAVGVVAYSPERWAHPVRAAVLQCRSRRAETVSEARLLQHRLWRYEEHENPWSGKCPVGIGLRFQSF